jgi:hypothetical protein
MFTLVHSPLVGPLTWGPVADRLDAAVPSLVDLEPPYWRSVAEKVAAAITEPAILVVHSTDSYRLARTRTHLAGQAAAQQDRP